MSELFLHLYHGRNTPDENPDDWGFDGPHIGPLAYFHTTYRDTLSIAFTTPEAAHQFYPGPNVDDPYWLNVVDDYIEWQGKYYGDWTAYIKQ